MNATTTTTARISRRTIEVGMDLTVVRTLMGQERTAHLTVATVREAAGWTVVAGTDGRDFSITNEDAIYVHPKAGEVWA